MSYLDRARETERLLREWAGVPRGTVVELRRDDGSTVVTATRSEPWDLCGVAVIAVDGIRGGYALARIRRLEVLPEVVAAGLSTDEAVRGEDRERVAAGLLAMNLRCPVCGSHIEVDALVDAIRNIP